MLLNEVNIGASFRITKINRREKQLAAQGVIVDAIGKVVSAHGRAVMEIEINAQNVLIKPPDTIQIEVELV
jgi:hypothetical protein